MRFVSMCPTTNSNIQLMKLYHANDSDLCASFYVCDFVDFNSVGLQSSLFFLFFSNLKKNWTDFARFQLSRARKII